MPIKPNEPGTKRTKANRFQLLARERIRVMGSHTPAGAGSVRGAQRNILRAAGDVFVRTHQTSPATAQ